MKKSVEEILTSNLAKINEQISSTHLLGQPIYLKNEQIVIPINKIIYCYGGGGIEYRKHNDNELQYAFAGDIFPYGGELGGLSIKPEAVLVINKSNSKIIRLEADSIYDKTLDLVVDIIKKTTKKK